MKKANGILVNKDNDYKYIDQFIDFLDRIIGIILKAFERLSALTNKVTETDAASEAAGT